MGKSSKVTHSVVRNSCSPLSDAEPTIVDSESDDQESSHSGSKAGSPNCQSKETSKPSKTSKALKLNAGSQEVSEPKYMDAKCFKGESRNSLFDEFKRKVSPATHSQLWIDSLSSDGRQVRKLNVSLTF